MEWLAVILSFYLSWSGLKSKSLSVSGAFAAFIVGVLSFISGPIFALVLIVFYKSGAWVTQLKADRKRQIDGEFEAGQGNRNYVQVFCNGGLGTCLAGLHYWASGGNIYPTIVDNPILIACLAQYACVMGDTFASEIGVLSTGPTILVTTFKSVKPGTNGGISLLGTLASLAAGFILGVCVAVYQVGAKLEKVEHALNILLISVTAALIGSMIDSLLGATLQATYCDEKTGLIYNSKSKAPPNAKLKLINGNAILSNNQVNLISAILTAVIFGLGSIK